MCPLDQNLNTRFTGPEPIIMSTLPVLLSPSVPKYFSIFSLSLFDLPFPQQEGIGKGICIFSLLMLLHTSNFVLPHETKLLVIQWKEPISIFSCSYKED